MPVIKKEGFEKALLFVMLKTQSKLDSKSVKERRELAKDLMKKSPKVRKFAKEVKKLLDPLLEQE